MEDLSAPRKTSLGTWIRDRFLAGIFVLTPIVLVIWIIEIVYNLLNGPSDSVIRFLISKHYIPNSQYFIDNTSGTIPGAGFVITLLVVFLFGLIVSHIVGRRIMQTIDRFLTSVPLVKTIYQSIQQLLEALQQFSDKSRGQQFSRVVYVPMAGNEVYCLGFLTSYFTDPEGRKFGTVFVPTPPSPVNGLLFVIPADKLIPADYISVEQATKMVISMGLVPPVKSSD